MRKIVKYAIPANGTWHEVELTGPIVHVAADRPDQVNIWILHDESALPKSVPLRVFADGATIEGTPGHETRYIGTGIVVASGTPFSVGVGFVWHLFAAIDWAMAGGGIHPITQMSGWYEPVSETP